jgi:hypothetical protein
VIVTADGRALVCPTCSHPLETAGYDGPDRLWYLQCVDNDQHLWLLPTALNQQPPPAADTRAPAVDPDPQPTQGALI